MDHLILKVPTEMNNEEIREFEQMVCKGEEVLSKGLKGRILRAHMLAFVRQDKEGPLASIGALKNPLYSYFKGLERKSRQSLQGYDLELGWIYTSPKFEGKGHAKRICSKLVEYSGSNVFATTKVDNGAMRHILCGLAFAEIGKSWRSLQHPEHYISLWIRPQKEFPVEST